MVKPSLPRLLLFLASAASLAAADAHWVVSWGASPSPQTTEAQLQSAGLRFREQTLREVVHLSIGGHRLEVRLSNAYGRESVEVAAARIALSAGGSAVAPGTDRVLRFGGRDRVTLPPDAWVVSDPVDLDVPAGADLAVSLYLPGPSLAGGIHYAALATSYVAKGDRTGKRRLPKASTLSSWCFLSGVDFEAPAPASAVAAFGDSITDGAHSSANANCRWPDFLARRLAGRPGPEIGVLDAGIGGNRLLHDGSERVQFGVDALARFDRDVIAQPGVRFVIVLEGINDIGQPGSGAPASQAVGAGDIIGALRQLIARAHEHGMRIFGGTLTPFAVTTIKGYYSPEKERVREAVNAWIRSSGEFDGVVDFDRAVRDPRNPDRILPAYDGGDHLHPGDKGYEAMGGAIDLSLFQ